MKKLMILLAMTPLMAFGQIRGTVLGDLMNKSSVSAVEAAAAIAIAKTFGLNPQAVIRETRPPSVTIYDSGCAYWLSREYRRPVPDIYRMRSKGKGWGVIAKDLGMHPGTFNKLRKSGAFERHCWNDILSTQGLREKDWNTYRHRGLTERDIVVATVLGQGNHRKIDELASQRVHNGTWDSDGKHGAKSKTITRRDHSKLSQPKSQGGKAKKAEKPHKGRAIGHEQAKGMPKVKEKGHGHGKGNGKGHD